MWKEEYEKLMFGIGHDKDTMSQAANIKYQKMPDVLYKYRHVSKETLSALQDGVLYSAPPHNFNDLFEGNIELSISTALQNFYQTGYDHFRKEHPFLPSSTVTSYEELFIAIASGLGKTSEEIHSSIPLLTIMKQLGAQLEVKILDDFSALQKQARNAYNIICLCSENNNNPMWTHYANENKGFCIGYEIKKLNNDLTHLTFPVLYKDSCYIEISDIDDINGSLTMHMLTLKSPEWSYEKEWRIFFHPKHKSNAEQMPTPCAVYLGSQMSNDDEIKVYQICAAQGIPVYKMMPDQRSYKLIPKPYIPPVL